MFVSHSVNGNVHSAVQFANSKFLARFAHYIVQFVAFDSGGSIVIFKVPSREDRRALKQLLGHTLDEGDL
jgi:hypothetical protein